MKKLPVVIAAAMLLGPLTLGAEANDSRRSPRRDRLEDVRDHREDRRDARFEGGDGATTSRIDATAGKTSAIGAIGTNITVIAADRVARQNRTRPRVRLESYQTPPRNKRAGIAEKHTTSAASRLHEKKVRAAGRHRRRGVAAGNDEPIPAIYSSVDSFSLMRSPRLRCILSKLSEAMT